MASRQRPPREPMMAGSREFRFYVSKAPEINKRFAGKHVAIIGDRVVASGKSPMEVCKRAKKSYPQSRPLLAYVPRRDTLTPVVEAKGLLKPATKKKPVRVRASRPKWGKETFQDAGEATFGG